MSSDSESFTSHSGSIENQLDTALETGTERTTDAGADDEGTGGQKLGAAAGQNLKSSGGFYAESADQSLSDELQEGDDPEDAGVPDQSNQPPIDDRSASLGIGQATPNWTINSPYVESSRGPEGREFELRSLSRQLCKKSARRGFDFKLMLVGESGIGKTTLIDSLFNVESTRNLGSQFVRAQRDVVSTTKLCERFFELEEGGVSVRLTVIDTPGFATELDSSGCVQPVLSYVERQLDEYYRMEQGTDRSKLHDGRVHALLYLINPSSRGLRQVDLMCLKALHNKVNIVPVIGKADSLTPGEKTNLKAWILQDIARHNIGVYTLPEFDDCFGQSEQTGDDFYLRNQYDTLRSAMPLAVVGSNLQVQNSDGHWARAREYPWGVVDIDNPEYSDFLKLRELLIMYMEDFKDRTHEVIYEQIRLSRLRQTDWQMLSMSKTLVERDRLLREKDEELRRLRDAVEGLQHQHVQQQRAAKSFSLPAQTDQQQRATGSSRLPGGAGNSSSATGGYGMVQPQQRHHSSGRGNRGGYSTSAHYD